MNQSTAIYIYICNQLFDDDDNDRGLMCDVVKWEANFLIILIKKNLFLFEMLIVFLNFHALLILVDIISKFSIDSCMFLNHFCGVLLFFKLLL